TARRARAGDLAEANFHGDMIAFAIMLTATTTRTGMKSFLIVVLRRCPMMLVPKQAPPRTPSATGAAIGAGISPRVKYTLALAAAVTPTMKLLVDVDTVMGRRMAPSI